MRVLGAYVSAHICIHIHAYIYFTKTIIWEPLPTPTVNSYHSTLSHIFVFLAEAHTAVPRSHHHFSVMFNHPRKLEALEVFSSKENK